MEKMLSTVMDGDIDIHVPLTKIDIENRVVRGFATVDNLDNHADIVTKEASLNAFKQFSGGIREMHQPKAVGKLVKFEERELFDEKTGKTYSGVYVSAYISKGAQDTWEKVLDGTLKAFSIKGPILEKSQEYSTDTDKVVQVVEKYRLDELSLVDNPGNSLCRVDAIVKSVDGVLSGPATETELKNVFWCADDRVIIATKGETANCHRCNTEMVNAGWVESGPDESAAITKLIDKLKEGGSKLDMADTKEEVEKVITTNDVNNPEEEGKKNVESAEEETKEANDEVEPAAESKDVEKSQESDEPDLEHISKSLDAIRETVEKNASNAEKHEEMFEEIKKNIGAVEESFESKLGELRKAHEDLAGKIGGIKDSFEEVTKKLDGVDKATAMQKSNDVKDSTDEDNYIEKKDSMWTGVFS